MLFINLLFTNFSIGQRSKASLIKFASRYAKSNLDLLLKDTSNALNYCVPVIWRKLFCHENLNCERTEPDTNVQRRQFPRASSPTLRNLFASNLFRTEHNCTEKLLKTYWKLNRSEKSARSQLILPFRIVTCGEIVSNNTLRRFFNAPINRRRTSPDCLFLQRVEARSVDSVSNANWIFRRFSADSRLVLSNRRHPPSTPNVSQLFARPFSCVK